MQIPHACVDNELCGCLKNMSSSRNRGRAVKATHNFANYNIFLPIAVIMASLAFPSISVVISCEFMLLWGPITWYHIVICTSTYSAQSAPRSDLF